MLRSLLPLLLVLLIVSPGHAQVAPGRGPWSPGPPDPCSGIALSCAQIDDFNLTLRLAGVGAWPGPSYRYSATGTVGITLSLYKTIDLGFSLPLTALAGESVQGLYGPASWRLRFRTGPRTGPHLGGPWPLSEPYPKALPASYDVRPSHWTAALGLSFTPLWPHLTGSGPPLCRGTQSGCLYEAAMTAAVDLRAWHILFTGQGGAHVIVGGGSAWSAGGRLVADIAGLASVFGEGLLRQDLQHVSDRQGLALVGAQLLGFRGAHLSGFYGRSFGGGTGAQVAGVALDLPIDLLWGLLQHLSAAVDPFLGADGGIYGDDCRLRGVAGVQDLAQGKVWSDGAKGWLPVGTHLWEKGGKFYSDQAATIPFGPVRAAPGDRLPALDIDVPWPIVKDASQATPEGRRWLWRFAHGPDPARRAMCEQLMSAFQRELDRGVEAPTIADACERHRQHQAEVTKAMAFDGLAPAFSGLGDSLAGCGDTVHEATVAAGIFAAVVGALKGRPALVTRPAPPPRPPGAVATRPAALPPGPAPLPPGRQLAGRPAQLALPPGPRNGGVAEHAPPAAAPAPRAAAPAGVAEHVAPPMVRIPPARQLAGPPARPALQPGPQPTGLLPPSRQSQKAAAMANFRRGQNFNKAHQFDYPRREVILTKPSGERTILDGYHPNKEIVSRKASQLASVQETTAIGYLRELATKYPSGRNVANVPSSGPLAGQAIQGQPILEVPIQQQPVPKRVLQEAAGLGIIIRDVNGTVYR